MGILRTRTDRRFPFLGPVAAAGLLTGVLLPGRLAVAFGGATLYVFLPALIFEAAWGLQLSSVRRGWSSLAILAIPGVIVTAGLIASAAHFAGGLAWGDALLLGTILSATDPIAVVSVFRKLPVASHLKTIIEGESLLNDGVAVVLNRAIVAILIGSSVVRTSETAIAGIALGVCVGVAIGYLLSLLTRLTRDAAVLTAISLAGAYGAYYAAEIAGWSGIFATIAFATVLRACTRRFGPTPAVDACWRAMASGANVVLIFLIGAAVNVATLPAFLPTALATLGSAVVARLALGFGLLQFARPRVAPLWMAAVAMAGLRGALSLALALAIPQAFAGRAAIVDSTFVVVVCTLLLGYVLMEGAVRRLNLSR